jgi:hypothetical protein
MRYVVSEKGSNREGGERRGMERERKGTIAEAAAKVARQKRARRSLTMSEPLFMIELRGGAVW